MTLSDSYDDLDTHMIGDEADLTEPHLGDIEHVERLLRGLAWRRRKVEQARALVDSERQRLADWLSEQEHRFDATFHLEVLEQYHRARLADDPKAKSVSLPSGTLTARAGQPRWEFDDDTFLTWASRHQPDLVRTKLEVDRAAAKKALTVADGCAVTADGERVPGVEVLAAETKFSVKVGDEG